VVRVERFLEYGHFYGCMGMRLLGQEFGEDKEYREQTRSYIAAAQKDVASWQRADGSFEPRGWIKGEAVEGTGYATAFCSLVLGVTEGRLSIYNRTPPELPGDKKPG